MIATDEHALMCDLAETYQIYDYKSLPLRRVAIFSVGLRDNSRIKMKMSDINVPMNTMLMALTVDKLATLIWMQSEDGVKGTNRPPSILKELMGSIEEKDTISFNTPSEFEQARKMILKGRCIA